jgi:hypothetical protein
MENRRNAGSNVFRRSCSLIAIQLSDTLTSRLILAPRQPACQYVAGDFTGYHEMIAQRLRSASNRSGRR